VWAPRSLSGGISGKAGEAASGDGDESANKDLLIGAVVGGGVGLCLLVGLGVFFFLKRKTPVELPA
jgi:hypothetical protein